MIDWLFSVDKSLPEYLTSLRKCPQPGKFYPVSKGSTEIGQSLTLGFSCFALKTYYTLGLWEYLPEEERYNWISLIQSFQIHSSASLSPVAQNAYIDKSLIDFLNSQRTSLKSWLVRQLKVTKGPSYSEQVILAETKQAIATLAQVGQRSVKAYTGFPSTTDDINYLLQRLDWTQPWAAGGQASALAVFVVEEAPKFLSMAKVKDLKAQLTDIFLQLADPETGGYFKGRPPSHGQIINGAMKVLSGLDWLSEPIHYPQSLIDTCLSCFPEPEGCHVVDAVYVLYRCSQQVAYKKSQVNRYCLSLLEMIQKHHNPDGGFSYFISKSQTSYYGTPISDGLAVSDIHGTCLFSWALAMIFEILELKGLTWKVIKP